MTKSLTDLLSKYRTMRPPDASIKDAVSSVLFERFGVNLDHKDIRVRRGVVHIYGMPALKQKIFIEKETLIKGIAKQLKNKSTVLDIN